MTCEALSTVPGPQDPQRMLVDIFFTDDRGLKSRTPVPPRACVHEAQPWQALLWMTRFCLLPAPVAVSLTPPCRQQSRLLRGKAFLGVGAGDGKGHFVKF